MNNHYIDLCKKQGIHPNKYLKDTVFTKSAEEIVRIDVTTTMIGPRGFTVLISMLEKLPKLTQLIVASNNLSAEVVCDAIPAWKTHPSLSYIDLSNNHIPMAGQALYEFVKKCSRITTLKIDNTAIRPMFVRLIDIWIRKNSGEPEPEETKKMDKFAFGDPSPEGKSDDAQQGAKPQGAGNVGPRPSTRSNAVSNETIHPEDLDKFVPQIISKSDLEKKWIFKVLEVSPLFAHLEDFELHVVVDAMAIKTFKQNETVPPTTDTFYLVYEGSLSHVGTNGMEEVLGERNFFGNSSLLYDAQLEGAFKCITDVKLFTLDRHHYTYIVAKSSKTKRATYMGFLKGVKFLKKMNDKELVQLADALKDCQFKDGENMITYGEEGTWFYLIREGTVSVLGRDDAGQTKPVTEFTVGACVGELEFINGHKCVADVVAKGPVRAAKMHRTHFEMCMGPVKDLLKDIAETDEVYTYYRSAKK